MALVVVDTNLISMLVKLKHGRLKQDEERARRYEAFLQGQDMIRAFPTEAELHVWLQKLPEDDRKTQYATGIQEVLDQTGQPSITEVNTLWKPSSSSFQGRGKRPVPLTGDRKNTFNGCTGYRIERFRTGPPASPPGSQASDSGPAGG